MRKLAVIGTFAAGMVLGEAALATQVQSPVGGALAPVTNTCFAIIDLFDSADCSYAGTRYPGKTNLTSGAVTTADSWIGPVFAAGFYAPGSAADPANQGLAYRSSPGDNKYPVPMTGTVTIDDKDTPSGADDTIAATWVFGAAVYNTQVGNNDYAIETWDTFTHVMAATTVSSATANADGGFDYVIGSRGKPTPITGGFPHTPLPGAGTNTDAFPSERALVDVTAPALLWVTTGSTDLANVSQRVGIERSPGFGNVAGNPYPRTNPSTATLQPNVGGQTTGSFTGYHCYDDSGDNDCSTSEILFGSKSEGGGTTSPPGFENVILLISTNSVGAVTTAQAYWTREYVLKQGSAIGNDPANQAGWVTPNSWTGGAFTFKGCAPLAIAVADNASVVEGSVNASIQVLTNDTLSCDDPNTVAIVTQPTHGTASVAGDGRSIVYSPSITDPAPNVYYNGPDSLTYKIVDGLGNPSGTVTVSITVTVKGPTAGSFSGTSNNGSPVTVTALTPSSLGSGTIDQHTLTAGPATLGTCTALGTQLTFTPTSGGGNGAGGCSFVIKDVDGDTSTGTLSVDVRGNSGSSSGGGGGPQLPSGGSSLDLLTLGALLAGLPMLGRRRRRD